MTKSYFTQKYLLSSEIRLAKREGPPKNIKDKSAPSPTGINRFYFHDFLQNNQCFLTREQRRIENVTFLKTEKLLNLTLDIRPTTVKKI